jgi:hypothetical protein
MLSGKTWFTPLSIAAAAAECHNSCSTRHGRVAACRVWSCSHGHEIDSSVTTKMSVELAGMEPLAVDP